MSEHVECVVIGAGVIGLAVARQMAMAGMEVVVLEKEYGFGRQLSSRNSGVVHAGIYYPNYSFKSELCILGNSLLSHYCEDRRIPFRYCGKLIVATSNQQLKALIELKKNAELNGVAGLEILNSQQVGEVESEVECVAALYSPYSGIVDPSELMRSLLADAERNGVVLSIGSEVKKIEFRNGKLNTIVGDEEICLSSNYIFNCSGLGAQALAASCEAVKPNLVPPLYFAKGNYYSYGGENPFNCLIYPLPERGGLGIHSLVDFGGQLKFGPDVEWVSEADFKVNEGLTEKFYQSIKRYWPGVKKDSLCADFASIRPKIIGPNKSFADFRIQTPKEHNVTGLYNLYGFESPGLTASLALAERIRAMVLAQ